jgi:hypothetical protein
MRARSGACRATGDRAYHQPPRNAPRMRARTPALLGCASPIPDLEVRSSPSAEPAGRRGTGPITRRRLDAFPEDADQEIGVPRDAPRQSQTWRCARPRARRPQGDGGPGLSAASAQRAPDAGEDARAPRMRLANPRSGEALGPERGDRRATGDRAYQQPPRNAPRMRARTPALPGCASPIPGLERRSAPSAETAGRRETGPISSLRATRPGCGRGRPRSQDAPRQSQTWRGARPRARSPQGDGGPGLSADFAQRAPDAGEDARAPRGRRVVPRTQKDHRHARGMPVVRNRS